MTNRRERKRELRTDEKLMTLLLLLIGKQFEKDDPWW